MKYSYSYLGFVVTSDVELPKEKQGDLYAWLSVMAYAKSLQSDKITELPKAEYKNKPVPDWVYQTCWK